MESDLAELDDWVGTLAELQLGLERKCSAGSRLATRPYLGEKGPPESLIMKRKPSLPARFQSDPSIPPALPPRRQFTLHDLPPPKSPFSSTENGRSGATYSVGMSSPPPQPVSTLSHSIRASFNPLSCREATAENDLNCLLRQLQEVEQTMKQLEQDDGDFTRRYSLASSSTNDRDTDCHSSPCPEAHDQGAQKSGTLTSAVGGLACSPLPPSRGVPQPTAEILFPSSPDQGPNSLRSPLSSPDPFAHVPPAPNCMESALQTTAQRCLPPYEYHMQKQQQTHNTNHTRSTLLDQEDADVVRPAVTNKPAFSSIPPLSHASLTEGQRISVDEADCSSDSSASYPRRAMSVGNASSSTFDQIVSQSYSLAPVASDGGLTSSARRSQNLEDRPLSGSLGGLGEQKVPVTVTDSRPVVLNGATAMPHQMPSNDSDDGRLLCTNEPPFALSSHSDGCHSNDGSLSDKSVSDLPEVSEKLNQVYDLANRLQINKLVVRIFRPDKTTKAILIDHCMTAGEVASMLIEKNFLEPSIHLCLVEKVPSLKVERVFEETENVADCILAWPTRSQNMIFFEQREDHYGFIESPKNWLGETFADAHGYHSSESVLKMLESVDSAGAPEWHDFLYIRKPGEKTWTRRFCVIRNSGLYTTKKNKRAYTPTGLIRLLVFDENIHIYTTTGGWSRMRAPTPHGFALKTYAAQDFSSTHVFCFCASDEAALRQWVCRLRIAMLGRRLLSDYEEAMRRISSRVQADSQQTGYKTLTRKSPLECRRTSKHTGYSVSPQRMPKRQVSTGSLNSSPVIKMPMTQQMPHSQHHSFTGSLSPPLPRPVGHHLKNGGTVDCYQYQNLR
ncbi:hypothetical protein AAHC03_01653 [Spirometra sp. Aus1]